VDGCGAKAKTNKQASKQAARSWVPGEWRVGG
jgi:hypothetical protein